MNISRKLSNFALPWLVFAGVGGLASGFVAGAFITVCGFIAWLVTFVGNVWAGAYVPAFETIVKAFPGFAWMVLISCGLGIVAGFVFCAFSAILGGNSGILWAFISIASVVIRLSAYQVNRHTSDYIITYFPLLFACMGGAVCINSLLTSTKSTDDWDFGLRKWLQGSWLKTPPANARLVAYFLPIVLCLGYEVKMAWPVYQDNQGYKPRIGAWNLWWNSHAMSRRPAFSRRASCQSNLKQLGLALKMYEQDYDERLMPSSRFPEDGAMAVLYPYSKTSTINQCPQELLSIQNLDFSSGDFTDYWFNAQLYGLSESQVSASYLTVAMGDGNTGAGEANAAYALKSIPNAFPPASRHLKGGNYAFLDGHVKWHKAGTISNTALSTSGAATMQP